MLSKKDEERERIMYKYVCAHCGSPDWKPIPPFDYMKKCNKCKKEFSSYPHN